MQVILDTNFILTCVRQKIDLFSQLEELFPYSQLLIPARVIEEIEHISRNKERKLHEREVASLALQILKKKKIKIIKLEGEVDDAIVSYALDRKNIIVASLDREIRRQLKGKKLLTIKKKKLVSLI